jgi:hypothetical protein
MFLRVGLLYLQQSYYESNRLSVAGRSARLRNKLICQEIDCNGPKGQAIHAAASNCIASQFHQQFSMNVMACYRQPRIESVGFWIPHESAMIGEAESISFFEAPSSAT